MKYLLFFLSILLFAAFPADGQAVKTAARYADDALPFIPMLFSMFSPLAGVAAIITAGLYSRGSQRPSVVHFAILVSIIGGAWSAFAWFGWPFSISTAVTSTGGTWFSPPHLETTTTRAVSLFPIAGSLLFALFGYFLFCSISNKD